MSDSESPTAPVTREILYEEVWTTPVHTLAKCYGLSDRGLGKLCARESIPVPTRGYWAKIRAGKKIKRPPLPPKAEQNPHRHEHRRGIEALEPLPEGAEAPMEEPMFSSEIAALLERLRDAPPIEVREDLRGCHPAVREAAKVERELRGRQHAWQQPWTNARWRPGLSVEHERRALLLLDAFARDAAARGAELHQGDHRGACVAGKVLGGEFRVWIYEPLRRVKYVPKSGRREPWNWAYEYSRRLEMGLDLGQHTNGRRWTDGRDRLEQRIGEVLPAVLRTIDADLKRCAEWERERREEKERDRLLAEAEAARRADAARRAGLLREATHWRRVATARDYVAAVERTTVQGIGHLDPSTPTGEWIAWARGALDAADPLRRRVVVPPTDATPATAGT